MQESPTISYVVRESTGSDGDGGNGHISQVGYITTRQAALAWEAEQRKQGKPTGP